MVKDQRPGDSLTSQDFRLWIILSGGQSFYCDQLCKILFQSIITQKYFIDFINVIGKWTDKKYLKTILLVSEIMQWKWWGNVLFWKCEELFLDKMSNNQVLD